MVFGFLNNLGTGLFLNLRGNPWNYIVWRRERRRLANSIKKCIQKSGGFHFASSGRRHEHAERTKAKRIGHPQWDDQSTSSEPGLWLGSWVRICLSLSLSAFLSVCLSVCLRACLSVCLLPCAATSFFWPDALSLTCNMYVYFYISSICFMLYFSSSRLERENF